jgi:hypothetical protein
VLNPEIEILLASDSSKLRKEIICSERTRDSIRHLAEAQKAQDRMEGILRKFQKVILTHPKVDGLQK